MRNKTLLVAGDGPGRPDTGPATRLSCLTIFCILFFLLLLGVTSAALYTDAAKTTGERVLVVVIAAFILALAAFTFFYKSIKCGRRPKAPPASGIDVLGKTLSFDVEHTPFDLGYTGFFRPGETNAGGLVTLLIFIQNYASTHRIVKIRFMRAKAIPGLSKLRLKMKIHPGQAVVFRKSLQVSPRCRNGEISICSLPSVSRPAGPGKKIIPFQRAGSNVRLFSQNRSWLMLKIIGTQQNETGGIPLPPDQFLEIYNPDMPEPNFDLLQEITAATPGESLTAPISSPNANGDTVG